MLVVTAENVAGHSVVELKGQCFDLAPQLFGSLSTHRRRAEVTLDEVQRIVL